jgi:uncharacterized membrane protein (DUF4010 family)
MAARNALILGIFQPHALVVAAATLSPVLVASAGMALLARRPPLHSNEEKPLALKSPFSLRSALKFGVIFLALQVLGTVAQTLFGRLGFYAVSVVGGFVSSASAVAAAAMLASQGKVTPVVAGVGAVLASLASVGVNIVLVARFSGSRALARRLGIALSIVLAVGLVGAIATSRLAP